MRNLFCLRCTCIPVLSIPSSPSFVIVKYNFVFFVGLSTATKYWYNKLSIAPDSILNIFKHKTIHRTFETTKLIHPCKTDFQPQTELSILAQFRFTVYRISFNAQLYAFINKIISNDCYGYLQQIIHSPLSIPCAENEYR